MEGPAPLFPAPPLLDLRAAPLRRPLLQLCPWGPVATTPHTHCPGPALWPCRLSHRWTNSSTVMWAQYKCMITHFLLLLPEDLHQSIIDLPFFQSSSVSQSPPPLKWPMFPVRIKVIFCALTSLSHPEPQPGRMDTRPLCTAFPPGTPPPSFS